MSNETLPACPAHGVRFVVPLDPEDREQHSASDATHKCAACGALLGTAIRPARTVAHEPTMQGLLEIARSLVDALERMVNLAHKGEPGCPATVISVVALALGSTSGEVRGGHRYKGCVRARHAAALALRECGLSMSKIADAIGVSDHTTVTNALVRARSRYALEPAFAAAVQAGIESWGLPRRDEGRTVDPSNPPPSDMAGTL